ncbi:MAG: hypothetical protein NZ920_05210 [Aigarchaeota archaeon]|nr:hypothetical protein [Aigarchaeota archaeon]MDW8092906.1 hypothetical protein [Nitrososphaerota archaeon]
MIYDLLIGLISGLIATALMSVPQYFFWRRWSTIGILEWHENQVIISRLTGLPPDRSLVPGFALHFINGGLAAVSYALVVSTVPQLTELTPLVLGPVFGLILWVLTLYPIHRPITGVDLSRHPLGHKPITLSVALHLLYGTIVSWLCALWMPIL